MRSELYRVNTQGIEIILTNFGICIFKRDVNAVFNNKLKKKHVCYPTLYPFAPGDFAEKHVLKLVEWFSGHCRAIKS